LKISIVLFTLLFIAFFISSCMPRDVSPTPNVQAVETVLPSASPSPEALPSSNAEPQISETPTPTPVKLTADEIVANIKKLPSGSTADVSELNQSAIAQCFFAEPIPDDIFARMQGKTFKKNCTTKRTSLRYIKVLYTGFDGQTQVGELVVSNSISKDITEIFLELYKAAYPIEKIRLADDYGADDDACMADNNTSAFNFRTVEGSKTLSKHALGLAIDINPLYNPYIIIKNGKKKIEPPNGVQYADRKRKCPYYIKKGDICHKLFITHGFTWGGSWKAPDYQHFSKSK